jgi:CheY-like chemotaxis protein
LRPAAGDKQLTLEHRVADDVPAWVRADGVRLRQVLLNLLTNAVKFTPAGAVMLSVHRAPDAPHALMFVIADTGPGIPAALRPRLFQPFARFDPSTANGSGLGLALVQGLCGAMGGHVRLDDTAARGATFEVELPLPACEPPAFHGAPAVAVAARGFAGLHVLVVEDNTLVREMLIAFLTERGARVSSAADGLTAIARAREIAPQVMLLDVALPGADGYAVAETLRREGPRGLRIIGLSAHAAPGEETRARAAGMDLFLTKPVSLARLAEVLSEASAERQPRRTEPRPAMEDLPAELRTRLEEQFASETPGVLAAMRAALERGDWAEFRSRAHYLKNSADVIGATALQQSCRRIAALEKSPGREPARELLAAVEAAVPAPFFILADAASADHP